MRRKLAMILAVLTVLTMIPAAGMGVAEAANDYSNIRVLLSIGGGVQSFGMSVTGAYFIQENGYSFTGGTLTAQLSGSGVVLTHSSAGQIYAGKSVNIMRERIDPSQGYIRATVGGATRNYLGHFMIKPYGTGLRVVNTVPMAHYLYGVVRGEMGNAFPPEALKAQAVAAKCYVIAGLAPTSDYDIGDTAEDQVYKGYSSTETNVINAVNATYDVGLYLGNDVLRAFYAASNGGSTLLPSDVWAGTDRYKWDKAYARTTDSYDPQNPLTPQETIVLTYDGDSGMSSGVASRLKSAVTTSMRASGYLSASDSVAAVLQISAVEKISTYNAYITMTLRTTSGAQTQLKCGVDMRDLMSSAQRKSMRLFIVTQVGNGFSIYQGRYGHGVGLSQRGAEQMAHSGMNFESILRFYYPGATIRSMGITAPADPAKPSGGGTSTGGTTSMGEAIATAVATGGVNLRKGPSTSTEKLDTVPKGTQLEVYSQESGFSLVVYSGKTGYVSNDYLTITPKSTSGGTTETPSSSLGAGAKAKVCAGEYTLMRSQASSSGSIVAKLLKDVVVDVLSESGSYYYVQVKGYQGYVLKTDMTVTNAGSTGSSSSGSSGGTSGAVTAYGETTGKVNFRKGPGTGHAIIKMLDKGTKIDILSKSGSWYHVSVDGTQGYLSTSYVKVTGNASGGASDSGASSGSTGGSGTSSGSTITAYGETTGKVNFRKGPGTSYAAIKMLSRGTKVDIYTKSGGWYHVSVNGTDGYISASYIKETGTAGGADTGASGSSGSSAGTTVYQGVIINEWVWLRSSPEAKNDNSNTLRQIPVGTQIIVYTDAGNNFYRASVDGQEGYVHKDYVRITGETTVGGGTNASSTPSNASGITTASVRLRSSANTATQQNVLTMLEKGVSLVIHGETGGGWYEVTVNGQRGYVSSLYVKKVS